MRNQKNIRVTWPYDSGTATSKSVQPYILYIKVTTLQLRVEL